MSIDLHALRRREVQAIGAAISCRDWHGVEQAYNRIRDALDNAGFTVSSSGPSVSASPIPTSVNGAGEREESTISEEAAREYFERGFLSCHAWHLTKRHDQQISDATLDHAWECREEGGDLPALSPALDNTAVEGLRAETAEAYKSWRNAVDRHGALLAEHGALDRRVKTAGSLCAGRYSRVSDYAVRFFAALTAETEKAR